MIRAKRSVSFWSEAKNPGFADALIFGTTGLRSGRSAVEGAVVGAEKDPGFFAALRITKSSRLPALSSPLPVRERIKVRVLTQRASSGRDSRFRLFSEPTRRDVKLSPR